MAPSPASGARHRPDGTIVALLSLKLLLLGFFIVLNAHSNFDDNRAQAVLESVNASFNGRAQLSAEATANSERNAERNQADALISAISELFDTTFPAVESQRVEHGSVLRLELSAATIFRPGRLNLQPDSEILLSRFAQSLQQAAEHGLSFSLEFLHGVPADATGALVAAGTRSLELRRAGRIARVLVALGLPADRLSVGVVPAKERRLQLVLRLHQQGQPMIDFLRRERQGLG